MKPSDDVGITPPEKWALNEFNSTGRRLILVDFVENSLERQIPAVSLHVSRAGESARLYGTGPITTHLSVDEAEALATLLMYQAQQIRQEQEGTE